MYKVTINRKRNIVKMTRITRRVVIQGKSKRGLPGQQGEPGEDGPQGEPGIGVPIGGTSDQILAKASNENYDTYWKDDEGGLVDSVNGQIGTVVLDAIDVGADPAGSADQALEDAKDYTDSQVSGINFPVTSVNGRTGEVIGLAEQVDLDDLEDRVSEIEEIIDVPPVDQTNLNDFLDIFVQHVPSTLGTGPDQNYRDPSPITEIPDCLRGIELLVQQMGERYDEIDLTTASSLLSTHGFTVEKGFDSVAQKPYVLIYNEWTYPSTLNNRAWGVYVLDMSAPMTMLIEAPHPMTDGNSEYIALDLWRNTEGGIYALAGNNRKAKAWLVTEIYTTATSGTFTLTFRGQTTAPLSFDSSRSTVQSALEALPSIGVGKVICTQSSVNTTNHCFAYLDYSLYDSLNPTDTITGASVDLNAALSIDHDSDVAHNKHSLFHYVCEKYGTRRLLQFQQHGFNDTSGSGSSIIARSVDVILSPGSSNTNTALYAFRDSLEAVGFDVMLKDTYDTQALYFVGSPTGGTFTLTYNSETTSAITYSATAATLIANVQSALEALSSIGTGNISVTESHGNNGTVKAYVITFAGTLIHLGVGPITVTPSLTGGTTPTARTLIADDTLLVANTNEQGDVAEANGAIFIHVEVSNTVRDTVSLSTKYVSAVTGMNIPLISSANMPALAEAGHSPSQTPIAVGRASITGSRNYAANAGHSHAWSSSNTTAGNNYIAVRNSSNTGNEWYSPDTVGELITNVIHLSGDETVEGIKTLTTDSSGNAIQIYRASSTTGQEAKLGFRVSSTANNASNMGEIAILRTDSPVSQDTEIIFRNRRGTTPAEAMRITSAGHLHLVAGGKVTNLTAPTDGLDAANKAYVDTAVSGVPIGSYVLKSGDTMTGNLLMTNSYVQAGTSSDTIGNALVVMRNGAQVGRIDNNSNGLRVQAQTGSLQLRGTGNAGFLIGSTTASLESGITAFTFNQLIGHGSTPTHTITLSSANTGFVSYNTSDQITNYERVRQFWSSNTFFIKGESSGSGTARNITLGTTNRNLITLRDTLSSSGGVQVTIGTSGNGVNGLVIDGTWTNSSGSNSSLAVMPIINQSGTGGYTGLLVNATETSTGSGPKILLDLQVGGVSKLLFDNTGKITTPLAQTYIASNVTTDRTFNANSTTIDELSDILGTLIEDLRSLGLVL